VRDRELTRLFLRRFVENDLISPEADRVQVLSQVGGAIVTGALFVTTVFSLGYIDRPYALPAATAAQVLRVLFACVTWSMTVMALLAVSVWDAVALDARDTQILGPLPVLRRTIVRAKASALIVFAAVFAAALNVVPGLIHPVFALSRLGPSIPQVVVLMVAHLVSTTAAAAFGFAAVLGLRELLSAIVPRVWFRRVSLVVQAGLVIGLVTTLLLIPAFSFELADEALARGGGGFRLLPPVWFVGVHDMVSGHVWAQLATLPAPARVLAAERAAAALYQSRRPWLADMGVLGVQVFVGVLLVFAAAYAWNHRRLPEPPGVRRTTGRHAGASVSAFARRLLARRPIAAAGYGFTMAVLGRSVQNRLSIAVPLAVAIAFAAASLRLAGVRSMEDFAAVPVVVLSVQTVLITAVVLGFRHSIRKPAELNARWLFHLIRPPNQTAYMVGVRRAAAVKLLLPLLLALAPLHVLALGPRGAMLHFVYGWLCALVLTEASLLGYQRLPFASSYVPVARTHGVLDALLFVVSTFTLAWIERAALGDSTGTLALFGFTAFLFAILRVSARWRRYDPVEVELDETVEPPTLRLGLMD